MTAGGLPQHDSAATFQLYWSRTGAVRWRLLAANNRELGRCGRDLDGLESAVLDAKSLSYNIDDLRSRIVRRDNGRWDWQLILDDEIVAESLCGHDGKARCQRVLRRFIECARTSKIRPRPGYDRHRAPADEVVVLPSDTVRSPGRQAAVFVLGQGVGP